MINDVSWWNNEFINNWEVGIDGKEQTLYFAQLMLNNLPNEVLTYLNTSGISILDWGCALGQAVNLFEIRFPCANVVGLDFAKEAIKKARSRFPYSKFINRLFDKEIDRYDVIYTSNCLEHFTNPLDHIKELLEGTGKYFIALVPYNQGGFEGPMNMDCHLYSFREESFPYSLLCGQFVKHWEKVIPTTGNPLWNAEQILVIYRRVKGGE